jgi:hypothetical protein
MASTSSQFEGSRTHFLEGPRYRARAYVSLTNLRSSMHGSVCGLTRRDLFRADFLFVLVSIKD